MSLRILAIKILVTFSIIIKTYKYIIANIIIAYDKILIILPNSDIFWTDISSDSKHNSVIVKGNTVEKTTTQ